MGWGTPLSEIVTEKFSGLLNLKGTDLNETVSNDTRLHLKSTLVETTFPYFPQL